MGQLLKLQRQIISENIKGTGTIVQVDVSSIAQSDFPSSVFFILVFQKKSPILRRLFDGISGSGCQNRWPLVIRNQVVWLNFIDYFPGPIPFQRYDDLPLATTAF